MHGSFDMQHACDEADAREERELHARLMAELKAAVAEAKKNYRHTPVKPSGVYVPSVREPSIEQVEEWAAIDEYEESGQAWTDRLAARAQAKRDGLVSDTHYNGRPGIDRRLFGP